MDPPLVNEASFSAANPASYSLTGIWPFPPNAVAGGLGLRIGNLGGGYGDLDLSVEESTVTEQSIGNCRKRRDFSSEGESSRLVSTSGSANELHDLDNKRMKASGSASGNRNSKAEGANKKPSERSSKSSEETPKQDYIHVRARRGQATDSHSLAERARREKISERMKMLQDLVPGCNKVIGKALVLDEIINYVQSLQRQVEFLSMKLEALNSRMTINPATEGFHPKDVGAQPFDAAGMIYGSHSSRDYTHASHPEWLHMQIGGNFERTA